jgi:hypothetical protein
LCFERLDKNLRSLCNQFRSHRCLQGSGCVAVSALGLLRFLGGASGEFVGCFPNTLTRIRLLEGDQYGRVVCCGVGGDKISKMLGDQRCDRQIPVCSVGCIQDIFQVFELRF